MNRAALFAPLLRGAIITKTNVPWIVSAVSRGEDSAGQKTELYIDAGETAVTDEKTQGDIFTGAFSSEDKIPPRVCVTSGGEEYHYLCAPDFTGIENIRRGAQTESWDIKNETSGGKKFGPSRADVVKNRIALVTGGARGFGEELTRGLIASGAVVFIADLNLAGAEKLAQTLNAEYGKPAAFPAAVNVSDEASVRGLIENIAVTAGGLDLCVSNAGVLRAASILEQDIESFKFVTEVNYTAFAVVSKHCALLMKSQHTTAPAWTTDIIQINSKSGLDGSSKNGSYAGSKFGGIGLVQSFAKELVEYGIKVNAVCPGNFFDGPLWSDPATGLFVQYLNTGKVPGAKTVADVKAFYEAKVPMNRGCTGPDVLRAVLYLVEQVYETGQALPVTGGQVMLS
ncbi:MAG: SDR family NAD(P)-dependent oxidoreductase [Treponema sp.]|jgi:sorbitol-6-phosphate 2-dehydrogenase|nr:SDR family NAD(P)-dependent oxidoreductase [Treponema sp.]